MLIIEGYKIETHNLSEIESVIRDVESYVKERCDKYYKKLLSAEIESLLDEITLCIIERPKNISIYQMAKDKLDQKVFYATSRNIATHYNLNVTIVLYTYKDNTYIKVNRFNQHLFKHIAVDKLVDYSISDKDKKSIKNEVWEGIMSIYSNDYIPFMKQIYPLSPNNIEVKFDELKFHNVAKRSVLRARYNVCNKVFSLLSMGQEVKPYELMPLIDEVFDELNNDIIKNELRTTENNARVSLVSNITEDMIYLSQEELELSQKKEQESSNNNENTED